MTRNLTGRAAAAAASMGQRAAAAGVGLCAACRHPVRLHGEVGCASGECFCSSTGAELRSGVPVEASPVAAPTAAELALLDVRCRCGHVRTEHRVAGSSVICQRCTAADDALYLARKSRDEHRSRLEAITGWLIRDGHAEQGTPLTSITGPVHALSERYRTRQTGAGPIVLTLPLVPDGAVALVTEDGTRFVPHGNQGGHSWWQSDSRGTFSLARILAELGPVTVEFAPPREPRTWPKLDAAPDIDDLPTAVDLIERDRSPLRFVRHVGLRGAPRYMEPGHPTTSLTLQELRALGEVREVLDDGQ